MWQAVKASCCTLLSTYVLNKTDAHTRTIFPFTASVLHWFGWENGCRDGQFATMWIALKSAKHPYKT